jgi:hypothetical protein
MKEGSASFSKFFAMAFRLDGKPSLFNPCLDSIRRQFSCRHGFTLRRGNPENLVPFYLDKAYTENCLRKSSQKVALTTRSWDRGRGENG